MFPVSNYMRLWFRMFSLFSFCIFVLLMQSEEDKDLISLPSLQNTITFKFHCGFSMQTLNTLIGKRNVQNRLF